MKSQSLYEGNFPAQTRNFAMSRQFFGESTDFHSSAVAAGVALGLNQDKVGAGCAGTKQAEQED